jgi:hypothetical protein
MKRLIWDYKAKKLLDCQDLKIDINLNPQISFGVYLNQCPKDLCQLEFTLDYSYFSWIQEWIDQSRYNYKRDLHLNKDIIFRGCFIKLIDLTSEEIKLIIQFDHYHPLPFKGIHRDLMINEILNN